ncbi:hypothetical protein MN608_06352 [Microdochium nivale]|nr:hypothetical protein MN608_06352 [Microdochium nivale]
MPPRLAPRSLPHPGALLRHIPAEPPARPSICLFCSVAAAAPNPTTRHPRRKRHGQARHSSTAAAAQAPPASEPASSSTDPRRDLQDALAELQKHAANYVNLSRVQLAINGLRQAPGDEAIRVAILGMSSASESAATAKKVARLLLADPLKDKESWEDEVDKHNLAQPMLIRVGPKDSQAPGTISIARNNLLHEVHVSSAVFNGHNLELMLMESNPLQPRQQNSESISEFEESVLVPIIDIPTSSTGRYTTVTTPVHTAIVVANGIMGAASVAPLVSAGIEDVIKAAVNLPDYKPAAPSNMPLTLIDVNAATVGLDLVRKDIAKAIDYEHLWFQSNLSQLNDWLKANTGPATDGVIKPPVRSLIASILRNATAAIRAEELRKLSSSSSSLQASLSSTKLQRHLDEWAQDAHKELQEQLDLAFESRRWRKLGWWKLFWRVDDVGHLTTDILNQRFLTSAERKAIFLAGRMAEAGAPLNPSLIPSVPDQDTSSAAEPSTVAKTTTITTTTSTALAMIGSPLPSPPTANWPRNIPASRAQLQTESVPALQSLAQRLVVQTLSTSALTSALGALVYVGTLTTSAYEAGAVAAIGIVWSLRHLQTRWESARRFWEGEIREEGRKAVRGVEGVMGDAIVRGGGGNGSSGNDSPAGRQASMDEAQRRKAKVLVRKAQDALEKLR